MWSTKQVISIISLLFSIFVGFYVYDELKEHDAKGWAASEARAQIHINTLVAGEHLYTALQAKDDEDQFTEEIHKAIIHIQIAKDWSLYMDTFYKNQFDIYDPKTYHSYLDQLNLEMYGNIHTNRNEQVQRVETLYEDVIDYYTKTMYPHNRGRFKRLIRNNYETTKNKPL